MDYDKLCLSMKQALACSADDMYEFAERDKNEEIKEAELEGLDDFLL